MHVTEEVQAGKRPHGSSPCLVELAEASDAAAAAAGVEARRRRRSESDAKRSRLASADLQHCAP